MSGFTKDSTATEVAAVLAAHIAGKTVLITGCSPNGLGASAALAIARHNPALIIIAGRTRSLVEATENTILAEAPLVKTRILIFDLSSLESVRDGAAEVNEYLDRIDILINNAGIMANPFSKTVDGFESQFGVNHLGPFLFTMLIVGKLRRGGRIVNVSSNGYKFGGVRYEDPNFEAVPYNKWQAYSQSKTANILFSESLAERLEPRGIASFSLSVGGGIYTNLGKHMTSEDYEMLSSVTILSQDQGASTYIAAAFDPSLQASNGAYLEYCKPALIEEEFPWAKGKVNTDKLWALSELMIGEKFDLKQAIICYGFGSRPEWMRHMGSWKEVMNSSEARLIRESAEKSYRSRRSRKTARWKEDEQELLGQELSGILQPNFHANEGSETDFQKSINNPAQAMTQPEVGEYDALGISHVNKVGSIFSPCDVLGQWGLIEKLPSTHLDLRSDMRLLMTFLDVIFPLQYGFYGLSGTKDRQWLLHTLMDTEPLYHASLGITLSFQSGRQKRTVYDVTDLDPSARRLQTLALRGLQQCVNELGSEMYFGNALLRKGMQALAIMTQLVSLEVFNFVEGQWEIHLQAARIILGMFQNKWAPELFEENRMPPGTAQGNQSSSDEFKALEFFITSFVWIDVIANATYGSPPWNPRGFNYLPLLRNGYLKPQWTMGCQSCIMIAITEITAIEAWKDSQTQRGSLSVVKLVEKATRLITSLTRGVKGLEDRLEPFSNSLDADSEAVNIVFAYAALVYLHTIVSGVSPLTPEIRHSVTSCLEKLELLPGHLLMRTCWPFTIAGCMATVSQYGRFRNIIGNTSAAGHALGTTWKGLGVIEECWRLRESEPGLWCWRTTMKRMETKILLI